MLMPVNLRAHSSKLPDPLNALIPLFNDAIAVALMSDTGEIKVCIALVRSANLIDDDYLIFRNPLIAGSTKKVLSVDEWVSYEIGRAHHRNKIFRFHVREALLTNNAVVHLSMEGQP